MEKTRLKAKIATFLLVLALFIPISYVFLMTQYEKKLALAQENIDFQEAVKSDLEKYREEYLAYINQEKENNKLKMIETKSAYEYLLAQQASIIEQHKKQIATTQQIPQSNASSATTKSSGSSSSSAVKKTVVKPVVTRSTKTS